MANTRASRKKQTQLAFTPLPTSSPAKSSQPEAVRDRSAFVRIDDSPGPRKKRRMVADMLPTPRASMESPKPQKSISSSASRPSRSFMNPSASSPMTASSRPRRAKRSQQPITIEESDSDEQLAPSSSPPRRGRRAVVDSDNDDDQDQSPPPQRGADGSNTNANGVITFDDSESDEPRMMSSPTRPRRKASRSTQAKSDGFVVDDDELDDAEADDSPPKAMLRRVRRARQSAASAEDDDTEVHGSTATPASDEEVQSKSSHRRLKDQQELESDLEFLGEADIDTPRRPASQKQTRQNALEALKQKRKQSEGSKSTTDPETRSSQRLDNDSEDDSSSGATPSESDMVHDTEQNTDDMWMYEAGEEEDFIDDDGQDPDEKVAMPFEFSQYKTMKPLELFKFAVEWMVQKKINPAFAITDEVYGIAFRRLDDYVTGLGSSKFQSSAWTPNFIKSLRGRPQLESTRLAASELHDRCDACNRSGHPATFEARFTGPTYNPNTLEVDDEDEEDSDEETSGDVPKSDTVYYVGKFCMRNSQQAHSFRHWKFHLNEWIVDYLKAEGELTTAKIVQRDGWSTKKRRKDAERIVDRMERQGEIKDLQRDFKAEISAAQNINNDSSNHMSSP